MANSPPSPTTFTGFAMSNSIPRFGLKKKVVLLALWCGVSWAHAADLTVSAAASLGPAFKEIAAAFETQHRGTTVRLNVAASDTLLAQIRQGAPVDVFASADQVTMDKAQAWLTPGSRRDLVGNTLVLVLHGDSSLPIKTLADLLRPDVKRIALAQPSGVPAGRYAQEALMAAGLWKQVATKAVFAQNVRQALDYVARGEVDAGFVYATDAATHTDRVKQVMTVPTSTPILYPIATVKGSPNPTQAAAFLAFVGSPAAQAVLARFGFQTAP
jgi:molybdate transport system substrate-binding protein